MRTPEGLLSCVLAWELRPVQSGTPDTKKERFGERKHAMTEESHVVPPPREVVEQVWPLIKAGEKEEALAILDAWLNYPPFSSLVLIIKAILLQTLDRPEEALSCYDLALDIETNASLGTFPVSPEGVYDTRMRRAELLEDLGRHEEALAAYEEALAIDGEDVFLHTSRGRLLAHLGRYSEALKAFEQALAFAELQGADTPLPRGYLLLHKANALSCLGRYREALPLYRKAKQDRHTEGVLRQALLFNLACTLALLTRYQKALLLFQELTELEPSNVLVYLARGEVEQALGRVRDAEATYARLAELVPAEVYAELPELRREVGRGVWVPRVDVRALYELT